MTLKGAISGQGDLGTTGSELLFAACQIMSLQEEAANQHRKGRPLHHRKAMMAEAMMAEAMVAEAVVVEAAVAEVRIDRATVGDYWGCHSQQRLRWPHVHLRAMRLQP